VLPTRLDDLPQQVQQLRAQADAIDLETWLSAAGLGDLPPGDWLAGTHTRAARWKVQPASASQLALNCPLASGSGYVVQAVLWLQWISTLGLAADKEPAIVLPAPGTPGPARMQIVFRDLLPDDFQLLTTDAGAYGYIEDLGQAPAAATPGTAAAGAASSGSLLAALTAPQDT
jgi:hypothetical protein